MEGVHLGILEIKHDINAIFALLYGLSQYSLISVSLSLFWLAGFSKSHVLMPLSSCPKYGKGCFFTEVYFLSVVQSKWAIASVLLTLSILFSMTMKVLRNTGLLYYSDGWKGHGARFWRDMVY